MDQLSQDGVCVCVSPPLHFDLPTREHSLDDSYVNHAFAVICVWAGMGMYLMCCAEN